MLNEPDKEASAAALEVRCYFVRNRNALAVRANFGELYTEYRVRSVKAKA